MLTIILSIAVAYLLGLGVLGYICLLGLLQYECKLKKVSPLVMNLLTVTHFILGIAGLLIVPAFLYGKFKASLPSEVGFIFAIAQTVVLGLVFFVIRKLNRLMQSK